MSRVPPIVGTWIVGTWIDWYAEAIRDWSAPALQEAILIIANSAMPSREEVLDVLYAELARSKGTECA